MWGGDWDATRGCAHACTWGEDEEWVVVVGCREWSARASLFVPE